MLTLLGGKAGCADYEKEDKRIIEEFNVPFVSVRPYSLTDKEGKGNYYTTENQWDELTGVVFDRNKA